MENYIKKLLPKLDEHSSIKIFLGSKIDNNILNINISENKITKFVSYLSDIDNVEYTNNKIIYDNFYTYVLDNKSSKVFSTNNQVSNRFTLDNTTCLIQFESCIEKPLLSVPRISFHEYIIQKKKYLIQNIIEIIIQTKIVNNQKSNSIYILIKRQILDIDIIFKHINKIISIFNQINKD